MNRRLPDRVHITSGILPSQSVELPENALGEALQHIELSFRTGPVLGVNDALRLPLPADVGGAWQWFDRDLQGWRVQRDVAKAPGAPGVPSERVEVFNGWVAHTKRE